MTITEIIEITDQEIIGLETKKVSVPIKKLIDYVLEQGFEHEGIWYFRKSWMDDKDSRLFEQGGLIKKAGTFHFLRSKGMTSLGYMSGGVMIYKVNDDKINKEISEIRQNG